MYVNTTGVGKVPQGVRFGPERIRRGDAILINGPVGEHEAAIALARGAFRFRGRIESDCAPLHRLARRLVEAGGVRMMRDPTRGGVATTGNEIAERSGLGLVLDEAAIPVSRPVRAVAELLGLDPLYMANEGKLVAIASCAEAPKLLRLMRQGRYGKGSAVIGEVVDEPKGVWLRTGAGSLRRLMMLEAEQLPRIC